MSLPTSFHAARELIRVKASGNEFVELVHGATNEDPWGPTGAQMDDVCRAFSRGSNAIMEEIKLRLKHREKSWRSCYKALLLLDHLVRNVHESDLPLICSTVPALRLISQTFYYTGRKGTDHGLSVRERAKKLCDLLSDGSMLREEREKASATRSKFYGASSFDHSGLPSSRYQGFSSNTIPPPSMSTDKCPPHSTLSKEEQEQRDMKLAAKMQREEETRTGISVMDAERMFNRNARHQLDPVSRTARNSDLELARRLEEEEEERRLRSSLRDDGLQSTSPSSPPPTKGTSLTGSQNPPASKPEPPVPNVLDDLFAPVSAVPSNQGQLSSCTGGAPAQQQCSPSSDPFENFLDMRIQQQQQLKQHDNQGQMLFGDFQTATPLQPQYPGTAATSAWCDVMNAQPQRNPNLMFNNVTTRPISEATSSQNAWGAPSSSGIHQGISGTQQAPLVTGWNGAQAPGNPVLNSNTGGSMEQQMLQFMGHLSGPKQHPPKSLDDLMAECRTGE